jgi:hypothetical protein
VTTGSYLVLEHHEYQVQEIARWRLSGRSGHVLSMAALVGLGGMVFVGTYTGGRTIPFYGVAALVGTLIFAQIFFVQRASLGPVAVLAQLVAFAAIVRWMALATTPGLIGVDSWVHVPEFAGSIRETGQLSAIAESHYYGVPLYHLLVVAGAELFDTTLRTALYGTLGIVMPLSILLVYFTARPFLPVRWALFAAAAFGVADHAVRWGIHLIPTSMGLVFFLAAFYGVAKIAAARRTVATYALVLFFALATIYTHHISTFILLVFLGAGAVAQLYVRLFDPGSGMANTEVTGGSVNFLLLLAVVLPITLLNWTLTPRDGSFLFGMIESARSSIQGAAFLDLASTSRIENEAIASMGREVPMSIQILDLLGFSLLLLVTLVGAFALLQREHLELLSLSWINSTGILLFAVLGTPMLGLYFLIPGRWYAFAYVPMVVIGAFGLRHFEANMSARQLVAVMILFALVFPGAMLVNHKATHDQPVAEQYYHKFAYSESELAAAETITAIHPETTELRADDPYYIYLRDATGAPAEPLELNDEGAVTGSHVVYRTYQSEGATEVAYEESDVRARLAPDEVCRPGMDVVYTIGDVQYCRASS